MIGCFGQRAALESRRLVKQKEALWGHNFLRDGQADGASMTHLNRAFASCCKRSMFWLLGLTWLRLNPQLVFFDQRVEDR